MATNVNLDALIPREDFEAHTANDDAPVPMTITITDLEPERLFYLALRKPDFQRESAQWDPKRVANLVKTFIDGDLIPSVILWKHREHLFVIDGSHRLSALIAWVQDDYGDGDRSQRFFGHNIPREQAEYADKTRKFINKEIGAYQEYIKAARTPDLYGPDQVARSRALGSRAVTLQWVRGDSAKAEGSFVRINQQAANITPQELSLIEGRRKPDVIAARAIIKRGAGYQSWTTFEPQVRTEIKELASEVHELLFSPPLSYPIKSLDLPAGGSAYAPTALKMLHDFVGLAVGAVGTEEDMVGARTLEMLRRTKRAAQLICSNEPGSVGLHPAVYFYSWTGKQQPILFLTMSSLIIDLDRNRKLPKFIEMRGLFEAFLMENRSLINQIVRKFGTKDSGRQHLMNFYVLALSQLEAGVTGKDLVDIVIQDPRFTYLQPAESPYAGVSPTRYSAQVKSGAVIAELLPSALRCKYCGGLVPSQAISIDHKVRRSEGGDSGIGNLQVMHSFCNTGMKG